MQPLSREELRALNRQAREEREKKISEITAVVNKCITETVQQGRSCLDIDLQKFSDKLSIDLKDISETMRVFSAEGYRWEIKNGYLTINFGHLLIDDDTDI